MQLVIDSCYSKPTLGSGRSFTQSNCHAEGHAVRKIVMKSPKVASRQADRRIDIGQDRQANGRYQSLRQRLPSLETSAGKSDRDVR